jgi:hypothetical protein
MMFRGYAENVGDGGTGETDDEERGVSGGRKGIEDNFVTTSGRQKTIGSNFT